MRGIFLIVIPAVAGIHCPAGTDNTTTPSTAWTPRPGPRGIVKFRGWFPEGNLVRDGKKQVRHRRTQLNHFITLSLTHFSLLSNKKPPGGAVRLDTTMQP